MADKKADDVEFDDDGEEIVKEDKVEGAEDETAPKDKDIKKEDEEDDDEEDDAGEDTDDVEVPVRSSAAAQHVITRQKKTIDKLRKKDTEGDSEDEEDGDEEEEKEKKKTPDISAQIAEEVERQNKPLKDHLTKTSDDRELQDLFKSTPDALRYKNRIKAIMNHPAYSQVPPKTIYRDLAFDSAAKSGAAAKEDADTEADHSKAGGRSKTKTKTGKVGAPSVDDVANMTEEAHTKMESEAIAGKFVQE